MKFIDMKTLFKRELTRVLKGRFFILSVVIGLIFAVWYSFSDVFKVIQPNENGYTEIVAYHWLGASMYPVQSFAFYMIAPLLASLAGSMDFYYERVGGAAKQFLIRTKKGEYYGTWLLVSFIAGGLSIVIPMAASILMSLLALPFQNPETISGFGVWVMDPGFNMYFENYGLYLFLYLLFDFVVGGGIAVFASLLSYFSKLPFVHVLLPFALSYAGFITVDPTVTVLNTAKTLCPGVYGTTPVNILVWLSGAIALCLIFILVSVKGRKNSD